MSSKENSKKNFPKRNPYKSLDFGTKMKILQELESGELSQVELAKKHGISTSTLSTFKKSKEKILQASSGVKRERKPGLPEVDAAVALWFAEQRNNKINLDGSLIRGKAEKFAKAMGNKDFKASSGWLTNWKKRNNVVFKAETGESGAVDQVSAAEWMASLDPILEEYEARNIFNADETGLFFKCMPDRTFAYKGDACFGGKKKQGTSHSFGWCKHGWI